MLDKEFLKRIQAAKVRGDLSNSDMGLWFERPQETVWVWTKGRYAPRSPGRDQAEARLLLLERAIADKVFPAQTNQRARQSFIRSKLHEQLAKSNGLSADHST